MSKSYYKKAENLKEEVLARFCKIMNAFAGPKSYGLTKGGDIAEIVTTKDYNELKKKEKAYIMTDGVIEIDNKG